MSDHTDHNDHERPDATGQAQDTERSAEESAAFDEGLISGRSASVRFHRRTESVHRNNRARMDAANQSLAEALKITYGLLQAGMVVLVLLFIFSGLQRVNEGERGIKVLLGRPTRTNIEPGAHFTAPYPIGEMIRVGEGAVEVALGSDFMPNYGGNKTDQELLEVPLTDFNQNNRLNPADDSMIITADQNIAHAQFRVNYHRSNHLRYVENILPENEEEVVRLAVRRGVVLAMAETTIDDLLKSSSEAIADRVRVAAQETLDELESGITIDRVLIVRKTPPRFLADKFASVQSAAQNAGKEREDAMLAREQLLNEVAGRASGVLIEMIDEYERLVELGEHEQAEELLARIDTVMLGGETEWNGQSTLGLVSGEVSEILNNARAQASSRVSRAIADLEQFRAKLAQYEANPSLMIARDWSSAMAEFLEKDFVSTMYLPEGRDAELLINPDQDWERERLLEQRRAEAVEKQRRRREEAIQDFYRTQRGIQEQDEP